MIFKLLESVETAVVEELREFFKSEPAVGSFVGIEDFRWDSDPNISKILISTVWPDTDREFPAIKVEAVSLSHYEIGFNQWKFAHYDEATDMEFSRVGGIFFISLNFLVGVAQSRVTLRRLVDILSSALVALTRLRSKLTVRNILPVGSPVLNLLGVSEERLHSGAMIYKASLQYPKIRVEWYEDIGIVAETIEEVRPKLIKVPDP